MLQFKKRCVGRGANLGSFWFSFIFSLYSSALDHSATAPPLLCCNFMFEVVFKASLFCVCVFTVLRIGSEVRTCECVVVCACLCVWLCVCACVCVCVWWCVCVCTCVGVCTCAKG